MHLSSNVIWILAVLVNSIVSLQQYTVMLRVARFFKSHVAQHGQKLAQFLSLYVSQLKLVVKTKSLQKK